MIMLQPNQLLSHMRAGQVEHLYSLGNFATPRHVDYVCNTGLFHSLWFDLEHFDIPIQELAVLNMVARAYPVTPIARFKASDYQTVMRVLETRVGGIMCSMVESAAEAAQIVHWAKFNNPAPSPGEVNGRRGWNAGGADAWYGMVPALDYVRHQNTEVAIICQIETEEAVGRLEEIVEVPGVNGVFFGPGDYAHRIGRVGDISHPDVTGVMQLIDACCRRHGKFWGTVTMDREHYLKVRELGARLIGIGGDVRVMNYGIRELARTFADPGRANHAPSG
jgi:4-hydroxy-2-oxoheptanedioate aldolase